MKILQDVMQAFDAGRMQYEKLMAGGASEGGHSPLKFRTEEIYGSQTSPEPAAAADESENSAAAGKIVSADNLEYMTYLLKDGGMSGKLQLIYADPPFFSGSRYEASVRLESEKLGTSSLLKVGAYDDRWRSGIGGYIEMLTPRLLMMRELLSETGCLWVHLDWHSVHYVKAVLDEIFGPENFVNEVIWTYKSGGAAKRSFAKKHDTLLFYSKSGRYASKFEVPQEKSYNRGLRPYRFKGVEEFCDDKGWYTMVNMKDIWSIDMVGRTSAERNGYATQKPEALLERIVKSCSREGDLCADFFAGSGTLGAVCHKTNRKWIMCDSSGIGTAVQIERMADCGARFAVERIECGESTVTERSESAENESSVQTAAECGSSADNDADAGMAADVGRAETSRISVKLSGNRIEINEYRPESLSNPVNNDFRINICDRKSAVQLNEYAQKDSLSLIKLWSVDPDYDGIVHRAEKVISGSEKSCSVPGQAAAADIADTADTAKAAAAVNPADAANSAGAVNPAGTADSAGTDTGSACAGRCTGDIHILGYDVLGNMFEVSIEL